MSHTIKIHRNRLASKTYWLSDRPNIGKPLIINVKSTFIDGSIRTREDAEQDMTWLGEILPQLGFSDPSVMDNGSLETKDQFFRTLKTIASDDSMTTEADVFLCVILAFGKDDKIYLGGGDRNTVEPVYVQLQDIINVFKADNCYKLACKPKIFIVHIDDPSRMFQKRRDKSKFAGGEIPVPVLSKVPIEADILVYQSKLSSDYSKFMAEMAPDKYDELQRDGLVPEWNVRLKGETKVPINGSHFIFALHKAAKRLVREGTFDLFRLVFLTNDTLQRYIDSEKWVIDDDEKSWEQNPMIPVCTVQLTKNLVVKLRCRKIQRLLWYLFSCCNREMTKSYLTTSVPEVLFHMGFVYVMYKLCHVRCHQNVLKY